MLKRYKYKSKALDAACGISIIFSFISVSVNSPNSSKKSGGTGLVISINYSVSAVSNTDHVVCSFIKMG